MLPPSNKFSATLFWFFIVFLLLFLPWLSKDFGISFDEWQMANGGVLALRFLFSFGHDRETLTYLGNVGQHPQFFNSLAGLLYGLSTGSLAGFLKDGLHIEKHLLPFFTMSHRVNAFFGFLTIFFAGRIAKDIGGARAGLITLLVMALSPRFIGDMMNNSKDIPFAAPYAAALFYLLRFCKELPYPRWQTYFCLCAWISVGIGVRIGGYLLLAYLPFFVAVCCVWPTSPWMRDLKTMVRLGMSIGLVFAVSYFGGMLFWPYAQVAPFKNPWLVFKFFSHFTQWDGNVLFEGNQIRAHSLPWYYLPKWIAVTVPVSFLGGLGLFAVHLIQNLRRKELREWFFILFAAVFPVGFIVFQKSIVYDGWRHVLFIYAPLCVLSGLGWDAFLGLFKVKTHQIVSSVLLGMILLSPLPWMVRNHPNEYVYFNPLVGGIDGAFSRYETDYFGNCIRASSEWLMDYHEKNNPYRPLVVRADGSVMSSYPYLSNKFHLWYLPYGYPRDFLQTDPYRFIAHGPYLLGPRDWDYAILLSRNWESAALKAVWPPPGTLYTVKADNTVLCAVVKNPSSLLK